MLIAAILFMFDTLKPNPQIGNIIESVEYNLCIEELRNFKEKANVNIEYYYSLLDNCYLKIL